MYYMYVFTQTNLHKLTLLNIGKLNKLFNETNIKKIQN